MLMYAVVPLRANRVMWPSKHPLAENATQKLTGNGVRMLLTSS